MISPKSFFSFLFRPLITFDITIPVWLIILLIILPITAYADVVFIGAANFGGYLLVCFIELYLIYMGYLWGFNTKKW